MSARRCLLPLAMLALSSCASAPVPVQQAGASRSEISATVHAPADCVRDLVVAAFYGSQLPVTLSQPGVVEARFPREKGILGHYEVFVRALIVPTADGFAQVTLFGEETKYPNAYSTEGTSTRLSDASEGRAGETWLKMQAVARALGSASTVADRPR